MSYRDTPEGKQQATVLRDAEKASKRKRSAIVAELPMEHDQYKRYLRGDTPLRWDQIPIFARVYGVASLDLVRALGLADSPWNMADALRGHIPEADIPGFVTDYADVHPENQRAAVDAIITLYHQKVAENTLKPTQRRNRPA